jgi:hypothetical protein
MGFAELWAEGKEAPIEAPTAEKREVARSTTDYLANESKLVPAGFLGLPVETVANAIKLGQAGAGVVASELTGKPPPDFLSTDWNPVGGIADAAGVLGYRPLEAPGKGSELAGDVMKGGAAGLAVGGPVGAVAGALSGVGANVGRHMRPGDPAAEISGSMIGGGVLTPVVASRWGMAQNLLNRETQQQFIEKNLPAVRSAVKDKVVRDIAAELSKEPLAAQNVAQAEKLIKTIPGVKMDIGQETQSGATAQRAKQAFRFSPESVVEKQTTDEANRAALKGALPKSEEATAPFARLLEQQKGVIAQKTAEIEARQNEAQRAGSVKRLEPEQVGEAGSKLKAIRGKEKEAADAEVSIRSAKVDQAAGDAQFPVGGVVETAERVLGQPIVKFDAANAPRVVSKIKELSQSGDAEITAVGIKDLRAMREAVNQDIADVANSTAGVDRRQLRALTQIKNSIDEAVEASGNTQAAQAYKDFNKFYATEYAPRFLRGENVKQTLKTPLGVEAVPDEKVFSTYLKPGGAAQMKRFTALYGKSPQAVNLMEDAIYDRYAKDVIKNGVIDEKAHSKFMFNFGAQLKQLGPKGAEIQKSLTDRATVTRTVIERQASLQQQLDTAKNDAFVNSLHDKFGAKSVDEVMKTATRDPRVMANLTGRMSVDEAKGLVNWFADDIGTTISQAGYAKLGETVTAKLSDKNYAASYRMALEKAYGRDAANAHIERLDAIQQIAKRLDATELDPFIGLKGEAVSAAPDALAKTVGFTSRTVFNMVRAVVTGRTSAQDVAFTLGGQFASHRLQQISNEVTRKLLTDPEMSKLVMDAMQNPPKSKAWTEAAWGLAKKAPSAVGYWLGADRYGDTAGKAAGAIVQPIVKEAAEGEE